MTADEINKLLIEKIESYGTDSLNKFHHAGTTPNRIVDRPIMSYIWGHTPDGYYMNTGNRGIYLQHTTGLVYRVREDNFPEDELSTEYRKHQLLYGLVKNTRMDIPVNFETRYSNNNKWACTIFERPNRQLGVSYFIGYTMTGKDPTEFFKQAIISHTNILEQLPIVAKSLGGGLPKYCLPHKYLYDDKGIFHYDFKYWWYESKGYLNYQLTELETKLHEWNQMPFQCKINVESLMNIANTEWGKLNGY